jgi:hypothetical protein
LEIEIIHGSGKAPKNWFIKNREWGGKILFTYWLYYGLIRLIKISSSNVLVYKNGGDLSTFVSAKMFAGIMWFVTDGLLMWLDAPENIMGRGHIFSMIDIFHVDLSTAVQKTRRVLDLCMNRLRNGIS